jgi:hypothetical protein
MDGWIECVGSMDPSPAPARELRCLGNSSRCIDGSIALAKKYIRALRAAKALHSWMDHPAGSIWSIDAMQQQQVNEEEEPAPTTALPLSFISTDGSSMIPCISPIPMNTFFLDHLPIDHHWLINSMHSSVCAVLCRPRWDWDEYKSYMHACLIIYNS